MGERENFIKHRKAYLTLGDLDKPFHLPRVRVRTLRGLAVVQGTAHTRRAAGDGRLGRCVRAAAVTRPGRAGIL
jgi:hypothetical protein